MGMEWMFDEIYNKGLNDPDSNISVIEVDMTENPYLDPDEIQEFIKNIPEEDVDARLHGKFVRRGGIIFKAFHPKVHVIEPLDEVSKYWELYASLDHGYNNPTAWLWHGVDGDGNVVTFAEHYESEMIVEDHAAQVKLINGSIGRDPGMYIGDPAIAQRNAVTGSSIQSEYGLYGINIALASNEVLNGINKVNTYLSYNVHKKPRWYITRNCSNLIREIQKYRWKTWSNKKSERQNNKFDIPHKKDDHACDSARYFFTIMPDLTPIKQSEPEKLPFSAPTGVDPYQPRYDLNSRTSVAPVKSEWDIKSSDEYMGAEW
jgi:hypothetical protein